MIHPKPVADAIEVGIARFAEHGLGVETCLVGLDGSDDVAAVVAAALHTRPWECVVIGGRDRHAEQVRVEHVGDVPEVRGLTTVAVVVPVLSNIRGVAKS